MESDKLYFTFVMNPKTELQALSANLEQLSAKPWSNITSWAMNARPTVQQLVPEHLALFDKMIEEPVPNVLEVFPGGSLQELAEFSGAAIARSKAQPEYAVTCDRQKQVILLFLQAALTS